MWYKSESHSKPEEVDATISKKYVYYRKDIEEKTRDTEGGETETYYEYMERKVAVEDVDLMDDINQNAADIEYLTMMMEA